MTYMDQNRQYAYDSWQKQIEMLRKRIWLLPMGTEGISDFLTEANALARLDPDKPITKNRLRDLEAAIEYEIARSNKKKAPPSLLNPDDIATYIDSITKKQIDSNGRFRQTITAPTHLCIYFIGGPLDGTQWYKEAAKHREWQDGRPAQVMIEGKSDPSDDPELPIDFFQSFTYKAVFIPINETTFSEAQIVIALFIP